LSPLILLFRGKTPQICFQTLVDNFRLAISLGMISCAELQFCALYLEQFLPKIACESWVAIRNSRVRHAMKLEDLIHEDLSHRGCCKWVLKGAEMTVLGKAINNHHDNKFISRFR
jgi:hypothetical protein